MPAQTLDLALDPPGDERIRTAWRAIRALGTSSEADHSGASHRPHVTLVEADLITPKLLDAARHEVSPLLPGNVSVVGTVVFGGGPFVVAYLLVPDRALVEAVRRLRTRAGEHGPWTPHLTLARRVPESALGAALTEAAAVRPDGVRLDRMRHWDPSTKTVQDVGSPA